MEELIRRKFAAEGDVARELAPKSSSQALVLTRTVALIRPSSDRDQVRSS